MTVLSPIVAVARRTPLLVLFPGAILLYGLALALYVLATFDLVTIVSDLNGDDAFYYYQIARNMAAGEFSTFDGGITRTNGYHPLWMLFLVPFYWFFDAETALFAIKGVEIMLVAGGIALVVLAARLAGLPSLPLLATPLALFLHVSFFKGMETALALFMLGSLFLLLTLWARAPRGELYKWLLAALAFALPWVRLEFAAISLTVTLALYLVALSSRRRDGLLPASLVPFSGALAGILVYFAYNQIVFTGLAPVSGEVKRQWSLAAWQAEGGYNLAKSFAEVTRHRILDNLAAFAVCVGFVPIWRLVRRRGDRRDRLFLVFFTGVFALAAEHLAKLVQTILFMHPRFGIYSTYYAPGDLMMPLLFAVAGYAVMRLRGRIPCIRPFRRRPPRPAIMAGAALVLGAAAFLLYKPFEHVATAVENPRWDWDRQSYAGVRLMNRVLPEDSVVGAWDAGVIGYFSAFPVVNLDGLVNSRAYLRDGGPFVRKMTVGNPHRSFGLTHLANAMLDADDLPDGLAFAGASFPRSGGGHREFGVVSVRRDASPESFRQRLAAAFDWRSGNVGVVFDGRLAQVVVMECAPDGLRNQSLTFVQDSGGRETVARRYPWKNARRNRFGMCVNALILPPGRSSPDRVVLSTHDAAAD